MQDNNIKFYLPQNKEQDVVAEKSITTLKNEIYKYIISISKSMYIDKIDAIVVKSSNAYHRTVEMKPNDVKTGTCTDFDVRNNNKHPKFKVDDNVRILK